LCHGSRIEGTRMTNELDDACARLQLKYPYQFGADFFELNPSFETGWMPIFERLCAEVDRALDGEVKALFRWHQVKEKLGGLRAYWSFGFDDDAHSAFRKTPAGIAIIRAIQSAEDESDRTCEVCGATPAALGRAADDAGYRIQTLCDEHIGERLLGQRHRVPPRTSWIYLFLDFDGVLLPTPRPGATIPARPLHDPAPHCDWSLVKPLAKALSPYQEIHLVVSSTWRQRYEIDDLQRILEPLLVAGITGRSQDSRYEEIRAYMYKKPEQWLALDDDDSEWAGVERWRLIKCDEHVGLNDPSRLEELVAKIEALRKGGASL
jgi:hypothetical protein